MHALFKPLWRIYLILLWSWLLIVLVQILFIAGELNGFFSTGVSNVSFGSTLIRISLISFFVWLTVFVIGAIILTSISFQKVNKLTEETLRKCDVTSFINTYDDYHKQIEQYPKRFAQTTKITIVINRINGYLNIGDYATAKLILDELSKINIKKSEKLLALFQNLNWSIYYLGIKDLEQARIRLEIASNLLEENPQLKTKYADFYLPVKLSFKVATNDFEGVEEELLSLLKNAKNLLGKVSIHYTLGQFYFHKKRFIEALNMFDFVTTHGGDTHFVQTAEIYLNQTMANNEMNIT